MDRLERMKALLARVKKARQGSGEIDRAFWCLENGYDEIEVDHDPFPRYYAHGPQKHTEVAERDIAPVSSSVDAVLPTFRKHVPGIVDLDIGFEPQAENVWPAAGIRWYPPRKSHPNWHAEVGSAATLPLALCATLLEAMIHMEQWQASAESAAL